MRANRPGGNLKAISLGTAERLCVLHAIGDGSAAVNAVTARLGLSPGLEGAVAQTLARLSEAGLVTWDGDRATRSAEGGALLRAHAV